MILILSGLDIDVLALIQASGSNETVYIDADRGGTDSYL